MVRAEMREVDGTMERKQKGKGRQGRDGFVHREPAAILLREGLGCSMTVPWSFK